MKFYISLLSVSLCACQVAPQIVDRPVPYKVEIAVPVPCKMQSLDRPTYPFDGATADMELDRKVRLLLADRAKRAQYIVELEAAVDGCAFPLQ